MDSQGKSMALVISSKPTQQQGALWMRSLGHSLLTKFHVLPALTKSSNICRKCVVPLLYPPSPSPRKPAAGPGNPSVKAIATAGSAHTIAGPEHYIPLSLPAETKYSASNRKPLPPTPPEKIIKQPARVVPTSRTLTTSLSEISVPMAQRHRDSALANLRRRDVEIYLKAPHFVSGGKLTGTIVVNFRAALVQPDLLDGFRNFVLYLRGVESIVEPGHFKAATHTFQFLDIPILSLAGADFVAMFRDYGKFMIPFATQLPQEIGGSYKDKKGSVRYQLQVELDLAWIERGVYGANQTQRMRRKTVCREHVIQVYLNSRTGLLSDSALYMPIHQARRVWSLPSSPAHAVQIDLSLPRSLWATEAPIYVHLMLSNISSHTITDIKLELMRRQNTFSLTGLEGSFGLKPVVSTCETVSQVLASSMGWLLPIEPGMDDQAMMVLQSPKDHFTVRSHKLIDDSYSIRLSLISSTTNSADAVMEIPVMLVHPISLDPPPGSCGTPMVPPRHHHYAVQSTPLDEPQASTLLPQKQPSALRKVRGWISRCQSLHFLSASARDLFSSASSLSSIHLLSISPSTSHSRTPQNTWQAPPEKFECGSTDMVYHRPRYQQQRSLRAARKSYPHIAAAKFKKRALASSRYLKRLQNKTTLRIDTGPRLLTFSAYGRDTRKETNIPTTT